MKLIKILSVMFFLVLCSEARSEEFVVIGTHELYPQTLSGNEIVDIFMGRKKRLDNGTYVIPVDIQMDNPMRGGFYKELMGKSLSEINSYWARLVFSGRGVPPRQADTVTEIIEIIKNNKGAIGYIPLEAVTSDVHILFKASS